MQTRRLQRSRVSNVISGANLALAFWRKRRLFQSPLSVVRISTEILGHLMNFLSNGTVSLERAPLQGYLSVRARSDDEGTCVCSRQVC